MTYKLFDPMIEKIEGSIICVVDGTETLYTSARELLKKDFTKKYEIENVAARNGNIVLTLQESKIVPNDLTADWAKEHMEKTGQEISFF